MLSAIIVAGGSSRRMGFDKTFALLAGKPVLAHTLAAFERAQCVRDMIIVGRAERLEEINELVRQERFTKIREVIAGGVNRQDSVAAGLARVGEDCTYVAVHDAARALVSPEQILAVFEAARLHGAAALAAPVSDTLKRSDQTQFVCGSIERENVFAMQTPQIFSRELLYNAYARVAADGVEITDEVSAVQHLGRQVFLVRSDEPNFKITFPADLALAEALLSRR